MTLKEFSEVSPGLQYAIREWHFYDTKCLCVDGATDLQFHPELMSRKIRSVYTNGNGHTIVEVFEAEN